MIRLPHISCTDDVCQGCALGKHQREHFLVGRSTCAKAPLELVHSDLMSFPIQFFLDARYVLTFIDEFSRCTWVYFLTYKSYVSNSFQIVKTFLEKQSSPHIKCISIDNGREYVN